MELLIRNGDYVPDGKGGFQRAQGTQELLQRVLFRLTARRGSFPFLPELGSQLYRLTREKPSAWESLARQYVAEALREEALEITGITVRSGNERVTVEIDLDYQGEALMVTVSV